jgi:hypothetical protein
VCEVGRRLYLERCASSTGNRELNATGQIERSSVRYGETCRVESKRHHVWYFSYLPSRSSVSRVGYLARTGVAVEKLDFPENRPNPGDQKCIGEARKSILGILTQSFSTVFYEVSFSTATGNIVTYRLESGYSARLLVWKRITR